MTKIEFGSECHLQNVIAITVLYEQEDLHLYLLLSFMVNTLYISHRNGSVCTMAYQHNWYVSKTQLQSRTIIVIFLNREILPGYITLIL